MWCLDQGEAYRLLEEIHEGVYGNHLGSQSLAHKALTADYYWPYTMTEAKNYIQKCNKCQCFAPIKYQPAKQLILIISPWLFAKWGPNIVGELPRSPGVKCYVLMANDYFTKWVKAEAYITVKIWNTYFPSLILPIQSLSKLKVPFMQVNKADTSNFIWKHLFSQFEIPC